MKILAIESSCDETAAAILEDQNGQPAVLSNVVASQIDIHKKYGGVVPEVAARAHIEAVIPVIDEALKKAGVKLVELDRIAVTAGPGLIGSLVVGVETAKALSLAWQKPLYPVNHLEGHIYANFITGGGKKPEFPLVALLVSGGHTMLIYMENHLDYQIIGCTRDDAAGEAFDKGAKILGLPYPGGPSIAAEAQKGSVAAYNFPIIDLTQAPKRNLLGFLEKSELSLDFSFSGLKTALLNKTKTLKMTPKITADLAASYQKAIIETLVQNSLRALTKYHPKTFILSGGVAANAKLRSELEKAIQSKFPHTSYLIPKTCFCTDNAAMIGAAAFYHREKQAGDDFNPEPNLELKSLS